MPSDASTIVYDGTCRYCMRQMDWIRRNDRAGRFRFQPNQDPDLLQQFPQLANDDLNTGLRLVQPDGAVQVGPDAVYHVARQLPRTRWLAWLYRVPILHSIARGMYAYIAARRYKLAGRCGPEDESCRVPDA